MARTTIVKAFRGQRTCQHEGCGKLKSDHWSNDPDGSQEVRDHDFQTKPLRCENCGKDIQVGEGYKWVAPRAHRAARGFKKIRCLDEPAWKQSELTSSPVLSVIYAGQEAADEALSRLEAPTVEEDAETVLEEIQGIAEEMGAAALEGAEMRQESASAIEDGFGHATGQSEELQSDGDMLEDWANDLEQVNLEDFTISGDDIDDLEQELADWFEAQVGEVSEIVGASPL